MNNISDIVNSAAGTEIELNACVYKIRRASGIVFVILRHDKYYLQSVYIDGICKNSLSELCEGAFITAQATVKSEKRAPFGFELTLKSFSVLSAPTIEFPIEITQPTLAVNLDDNIKNRTVSLKHPSERKIFELSDAITSAFCEYMSQNGFMSVHTPTISADDAASEKEYIKLKYFGNDAVLNKSPKIYHKICMGAFDKVYEISTGYSVRNKNSTRHLNEFTRLGYATAYMTKPDDIIDSVKDVFKHIRSKVTADFPEFEFADINNAPQIDFTEMLKLFEKPMSQPSLDPTDEIKLSSHFNSDFVFVTGLPDSEKYVYAESGKNVVLLYKGTEIASGEVGISNLKEQEKKLSQLNMSGNPSLLSALGYALPPHINVSIGLERFVSKIAELDNIKRASLFPRDMHYLKP